MRGPAPADLCERDRAVIGLCLWAAVRGRLIPQWECRTALGLDLCDVRSIALAWPDEQRLVPDEHESAVTAQRAAATCVMEQLLGYPHGIHGTAFVDEVGASEAEVADALRIWRCEFAFLA
jgi:hypothetical protein